MMVVAWNWCGHGDGIGSVVSNFNAIEGTQKGDKVNRKMKLIGKYILFLSLLKQKSVMKCNRNSEGNMWTPYNTHNEVDKVYVTLKK